MQLSAVSINVDSFVNVNLMVSVLFRPHFIVRAWRVCSDHSTQTALMGSMFCQRTGLHACLVLSDIAKTAEYIWGTNRFSSVARSAEAGVVEKLCVFCHARFVVWCRTRRLLEGQPMNIRESIMAARLLRSVRRRIPDRRFLFNFSHSYSQ